MPIYQYDCQKCRRRVEVLVRSLDRADRVQCPQCGGKKLKRVVSLFARARTDSQRVSEIDTTTEQGRLEAGDVGSFARWARRAGAEYDEALGTNYRELAEKADAGEDPVERIDAGYSFNYKVEEKRAELTSSGGSDPAPAD